MSSCRGWQLLISSLLKNSFGSSFRGALRHGISLLVGFWRGGILYSVRDGVFRSIFQQTVNRPLAGRFAIRAEVEGPRCHTSLASGAGSRVPYAPRSSRNVPEQTDGERWQIKAD